VPVIFSNLPYLFTDLFLPEGKILKCQKSQVIAGVCGDGENCIKGQRKEKLKRGWWGDGGAGGVTEYLINNFTKA
jgi:hypothetical protein